MSSFMIIRADAAVYTSIEVFESPAGKGNDEHENRMEMGC
jgi:hypothetical protein